MEKEEQERQENQEKQEKLGEKEEGYSKELDQELKSPTGDAAEGEQSEDSSADAGEELSPSDRLLLAQQEIAEYRELYLRARADLENYRRRARKDLEDAVRFAALPLVEDLLPVLDNFQRALADDDIKKNNPSFYQGIEMVYRQMLEVLRKAGLAEIEALGQQFNPYLHNAVGRVEEGDEESGTIVEELQSGYKFLDRVIRPAMVKVKA